MHCETNDGLKLICLSVCLSVDYVKGFGGKFGVQTDRQDKSALGWDHQEKLQQHESQKGKNKSEMWKEWQVDVRSIIDYRQ